MKKNILVLLGLLSLFMFSACNKVDDLPMYNAGTAPVLSASASVLAPQPVDSLKPVLTLSWTNPAHATDTSRYKFVVDMDTTGKNFSKAASFTVMGTRSMTFAAKDINTVLVNRGYAFNVPVDLDFRVTSSYANNNERLTSNTVKIKFTPYKVPPKVALPASGRLFIVGDATTFGWSNDAAPAFPASREFARLDETTWGGIFFMNGTGAYKLLQTQGNWGTQFHMVTGGTATAGSFIQEDADPAFPSPAASGWYKILVDFQSGKYTVTPFGNPLPQELYLTGDATASGWVNNPPAAQKFARLNSVEYEITTSFAPGKFYKFLSSFNNWQPQFGGSSATGGTMGANWGGGSDPDAVPTPATNGTYKVRVNFFSFTYKVGP